jgi:hypothetical protein
MGHISGAKSNLVPLIDRLNQYPIGLVDNEILRELLSLLFTGSPGGISVSPAGSHPA